MKTRIILFAAAVMALFACNKENEAIDNPSQSATAFREGQEVTIGVSSGKVSTKVTGTDDGEKINLVWEKGDSILVTVGDKSAKFVLSSGAGSDEAEFTGTMPGSGSSFDIQYPATTPDLSSQAYKNDSIPANTMSFTAEDCTLDETAVLEAGFSVLQLNFTGTQAIKKIAVETVDATSAKSYTLNINEAVTLTSTAKAFYVVTDKIEEKLKVSVYDDAATPAEICNFTTTDKINLNQNNYGCVNMPAKEVKKVLFSVSATKTVQFTKGNLWWGKKGSETTAAWHLEDNQTDYPTEWSTDHVGHLFWTKTAANSYAESYNDGECTTSDVPFFAESTGGLTVEGQSGLYALSKDEWSYLLSSTGRGDGDSKFKKNVNVNGVKCLVIAPDGYTGSIASSYNAAAWATAESAGLVCLPAAGYWDNLSLSDDGSDGNYWSATPCGGDQSYAYYLYFEGSNVYPSYDDGLRSYRFSVRLVSTVSK